MLDHTEDSATQVRRLAEATNERDALNEQLKFTGSELNKAKIAILEAKRGKDDNLIW